MVADVLEAGGFFMLQSSEQLKATNAPNWRNQLDQIPDPTMAIQYEVSAAINKPDIRERTAKETSAYNAALKIMSKREDAAEDRAQARLSALTLQKPTVEEHLENEQIRNELHKRLADQLLDKSYTARAGSVIHFPTPLISNLIRTAKRVTMQEAGKFTFIAHGHNLRVYKDNTPTTLLVRAKLIESTTQTSRLPKAEKERLLALEARPLNTNPTELTTQQESYIDEIASFTVKYLTYEYPTNQMEVNRKAYQREARRVYKLHEKLKKLTKVSQDELDLEEYLINFDLIATVTESAIYNAINNSKISPTELMLALSSADIKDRKDKALQTRGIEALALNAGTIGGAFGNKKCSYHAVSSYRTAREKEAHFLSTHFITNGKVKIMLSDAGSTLAKRRAEMYCVAKGIQTHEEATGKSWMSLVCTLKGIYHANPKYKKEGHIYNGMLPDDAAKLLSKYWGLVRANLEKIGIILVGLRTVEAQGDATPHMNFLVYFPNGRADKVEKAFRDQFGYTKEAVKIKRDTDQDKNGNSASFASYAFKYFTKFLNNNPDAKAEVEASWRRAHRIRGYAFFGIAPLKHWRLLRKSSKAPEGKFAGDLLYDAWKAARDSDFAKFLSLTGGTAIRQSHRTIQTVHDVIAVTPTGSEEPTAARKIAVGVYESTATVKNVTKIVGGRFQFIRGIKRRVGARVILVRKTVINAGDQFITKKLGEWKIEKAQKSEELVTLTLKLPRAATNAAGKTADPPPKIQITLH